MVSLWPKNYIFLLFLFLVFLFISCTNKEIKTVKGLYNLTNSNFPTTQSYQIGGQWETWEGQTITPLEADTISPTGFESFPAMTIGYFLQKDNLADRTIRIQLILPSNVKQWALAIPQYPFTYRMYLNGKEIASTLNSDSKEEKLISKPRLVIFSNTNQKISILMNIHDSKYSNSNCNLEIGSLQSIVQQSKFNAFIETFTSCILFTFAICFLLIFITQSKKLDHLWLTILNLSAAGFVLFHGEHLVLYLLPFVPINIIIDTELFIFFAMVASGCFYFQKQYSKKIIEKLSIPFLFYTLFFVILITILPLDVFYRAFPFYLIPLILVLLSLLVYINLPATRSGNLIINLGVSLVLLTGIVDILNVLFTGIPSFFYLPYAIIIFNICFLILSLIKYGAKIYELEKQAAGLKAVDKTKDDFLARVSHELRTPLHGMIGIIEAFQNQEFDSLTDRQLYHMQLLGSSGKRLLLMVTSILDFSHLKNGTLTSYENPVNLKQTIDFLVPSLLKKVSPNVKLLNRIPDTLPEILGDEGWIQQVFLNVLNNSITHTQQGSIIVEAHQKDQIVLITLKDTGSGIPKDKLQGIFDPFNQIDDIDTRLNPGLGLGLAICQEMIRKMHGSISLTSILGVGTSVSVTLPICPATRVEYFKTQRKSKEIHPLVPDQPIIVKPELQASATSENQQTILIVDDERINLTILRSFLTKLGFYVIEASNGYDALKATNNHKIDLIILDIMMPEMSGFEVCTTIRKTFSPSKLPIILLTAKSAMEDLLKGYECGASDYLTKPFVREEMKARIDFHLNLTKEQ